MKSRNKETEEYIANMINFAYDELNVAQEDLERLNLKDKDGYVFI